MGKLKKLRSRLFSSIEAVKRSVLRRQSQDSTVSNSNILAELNEEDLPLAATTTGSRERSRRLMMRRKMKKGDGNPCEPAQQLQLHWSEARRIYSEPMQTIERLASSRGEASNKSSSSTAVTDCRSLSCAAVPCRFSRRSPSLTSVQVVLASKSAGGVKVAASSLSSDEEENDDVFLESWEVDQSGGGCTEEDFLLRDGLSFSEFSSGYSTVSNDNLPSPALYLPPPPGDDGACSDIEHRDGGVSGWDDWRIAESEVSLGPVLTSTEQETTYSGYWHGTVQVRSRKVREMEDLTSFLEEVTTLSCIRHENIQLFMGACLNMHEGVLAIVMSEIKGDTLYTRLHHYGHAFTNPSKIKILRQIVEGMEYLHARGIPHGLLSSSSISLHSRVCISLAPQYSRSKVRQLQPRDIPYLPPECIRELHASQSRSHVVSSNLGNCGKRRAHSCGSQWVVSAGHFMAMQTTGGEMRACVIQLEGRPTLSADVFAFGTIVYELMLLEYPYKSFSLETQIWRVGKGETQGLTLLPRGQLRSIIACCWKENLQHRPTFKDILVIIEHDAIATWTHSFGSAHSLPCISATSTSSLSSSSAAPDTPSSRNFSNKLHRQ